MRSCWIAVALLSVGWTSEATWSQGPESATPTVGIRDLSPKVYALEHLEIVVRPGATISNGTVLVRDGSIVAVGTDVAIPPGTERIDHSGHKVYAGLIDAFSEVEVPHPARDAGAPHWNGNVMPQRSAASVAAAGVMDGPKLRSQGITLRLIAPEGGIVKGVSCLMLCGDGPSGQLLIRDAVWHHLSLTVPRHRSGSYPNSPMGAVALLRQSVLDARWYRDAHAAYRSDPSLPRPDTDAALAALADALDAVFVVDAPNERMAQRADALAKELRINVVLRGSGREYRQLDRIAAGGRPLLLPVDFPDAPKVDSAADARETPLVDLLDWELAPSNPARMAEAGATFCLTTDGLEDSAAFLKQIRKAVQAGLDVDQALAAVTVNPAKLLGVDDWAGTVQPGRIANLVVTDGDLFAEKTKTLETWVAGRRYEVSDNATEYLEAIDGCWMVSIRPDANSPAIPLRMELKQKKSSLTGELFRASDPSKPDPAADDPSDADAAPAESDIAPKAPDAHDDQDPKPDDPKGEDPKGEDPKGEDPKGEDPKGEDPKGEDPKGEDPKGEDPKGEDPKGEDPKGEGSKGEESTAEKSRREGTESGDAVELTRLLRERDRLSAAVDLSKIDETFPPGVSWISLVTMSVDDGRLVVEGSVRLPSGEVLPIAVQSLRTACTATGEARKDDAPPGLDASAEKPAVGRGGERKSDEANKLDADSPPVEPVHPLGAYGLSEPPEARPLVMFRGATVWTCGPAGVIEAGDVLVRDGRIAAVGRNLETPEGCEIIDVTGKHLTPGLIDCHSHMATDGGVNESGQAITAEVRIGDFIDNSDISIYRQLAGGLTTANILHGSANPIGGQNQVIKLRWGASMDQLRMEGAPSGIKFALGENVKRSRGRYPDTRMGVEQIIRDQLLAAKEYRDQHRRYRNGDREILPPRTSLQLEALAEVLEGTRWIHCHSYRQDEIFALLDVLDEFGIQVGSLQHILEGYKVADRMLASGAMASSFSDWWAYKFEVYDAIPYNGALMHDVGVVVSFNSDNAELARHLNTEAAKAVKYGGVAAEEAIKFVTLNPARQLRIDDRVGSLETGKDADMVIWSRSPLSTMARCEQTWIDGRCYFSLQRDAELRERDALLHARLIQKALDRGERSSGARKTRVEEEDRWHRHDIYCGHGGHDHHDLESELFKQAAGEVHR